MEQYGLTRVTSFLACRLELDAVARLLWFSWCVLVGADFFPRVFSMGLHFQIRTSRAVSVDSVKGLRQSANLPTENSRPPIPTRCTIYLIMIMLAWGRSKHLVDVDRLIQHELRAPKSW